MKIIINELSRRKLEKVLDEDKLKSELIETETEIILRYTLIEEPDGIIKDITIIRSTYLN